MDPRDAEKLLFDAAFIQAFAQGYRLGEGADQHFRHTAGETVRQIWATPGDPETHERELERAARAFRLMVDTMIVMRREAYRDDPPRMMGNVIGELTLSRAYAQLCPGFWPFC